MIDRLRRRLVRRSFDDRGAILLIAIIIVTVVAVVTGLVLTRGDGSLRATIALRDVARSSYAADGAAQVAINALRTGYNVGDGEPSPWFYTNVDGTGCFGFDGSGGSSVPKDTLPVDNVIPKEAGDTQSAMSAAVVCEPENATGEQGSAVPINSSNKPGYAIVTLGDRTTQTGGTLTAGETLKVHGGIYANGNIAGPVSLTAGDVRATGNCPSTTVTAPATKRCADAPPAPGPIGDPNYNHELGNTVPVFRTPPTTCTSSVAVFEPGYYDSAAQMNAATALCNVAWFKPGNYYFDFRDETCTDICPNGVFAGTENVWTIPRGKDVLGGTPTNPVTGAVLALPPSSLPTDDDNELIPGNCQSPITNVNAVGVQFVFGGNSRLYLAGGGSRGARMELCASYHANRPPIEIYGLKTGDTPTAANDNGSTVTAVGAVGNYTGATVANLNAADGNQATNANLAVWARNNTGPNSIQSSSVTVSGFAPGTTIPKGAIVTAATLRVTHRSTGSANAMTLTPNLGTGPITYTLPARVNLGTENINLAARSGWSNFQKAVHDEGFTGASFKFDGFLGRNQTSQLDAVSLDLTYYVPVLRGQQGTCIETGTSCPLLSTDSSGNNKIQMYLQGTTYAPYAHMSIVLSNFSAEVAKFGVIVRSLSFTVNTGNPRYSGPVFEIPDDSPGFGFETTLVRLKVYLCPGVTSGCTPDSGELHLEARVKVFDPGGILSAVNRKVDVLSWSHQR